MKKLIPILYALIAWFAVVTQYFLMIENRVASVGETTIRFFSFFTILTNTLVAVYFTVAAFKSGGALSMFVKRPGILTAITCYITIVGLVYQLVLRQLWHPTGMQRVVDELLHSLIPLLVIIYWSAVKNKRLVTYRSIPQWLVYPLVYLVYILLRGNVSNFYPYPFVDVTKLGFAKVMVNSIVLLGLFAGVSALFIWVGKAVQKA